VARRPNVIGGVDLDRGYSIQEITELYTSGRLAAPANAGYIVRGSMEDGLIYFVPANETTLHNMAFAPDQDEKGLYRGVRGGRTYQSKGDLAEAMRLDVEREHPMVRRTVQKKKEAMIKRLLETAKVYGTIPGLTDEQISAIIGERWKTGVSVVTSEMLSRVSAHLLGVGESDNKEADRHRVTRQHALA
jgi:hypothetical protein